MTAMNACVQGRFAYLITDMALTEQATGEVFAIDSKFIRGTYFPWGLVFHGNANPHTILDIISLHQPVDAEDMTAKLPSIMRALEADADARGLLPFRCAMIVAMWCQRKRRPKLAIIANEESSFGSFVPPMQAFEVRRYIAGIPAEEIERRWPGETMFDPEGFDVERDSIELVGLQRETLKWANVEGAAVAHRVGGGVQMMRVGKRGVTIKTLHTWPEDKVGALINPKVMAYAGAVRSGN